MTPLFKQTARTAQVTLSSGAERVTLTVERPPLLFSSILDRALPLGDEGDPETAYRLSLRSVLWAAEGLRSSLELPPRPSVGAGEAAWQDHAEDLAEQFKAAGLLGSHIRELASAALDLNIGDPKKTNLTEALAEAGND